MITHAQLLQVLAYDAKTGVFIWKVRPNGRVPAGTVAGFVSRSGHLRLKFQRRTYQLHHLAWFYVHGDWPAEQIDHKNCDPADNRISNLRLADASLNAQNRRRPHAQNTTGYLGVSRDKNRFRASLRVGLRSLHIGSFLTAEAAHAAYVEAKRRLHAGNTL